MSKYAQYYPIFHIFHSECLAGRLLGSCHSSFQNVPSAFYLIHRSSQNFYNGLKAPRRPASSFCLRTHLLFTPSLSSGQDSLVTGSGTSQPLGGLLVLNCYCLCLDYAPLSQRPVNFFPCFSFHSKATFPVKPPYEKFQPIIPHSSLFLLLGIYYYTILYNVHTNLYFQFTSQTISSLRMESFGFLHFCIPLCLSHSK